MRVDVRSCGNAGGIKGLQLLAVLEDVGELPGEQLLFFGGELEVASAAMRSTSATVRVVDTGRSMLILTFDASCNAGRGRSR